MRVGSCMLVGERVDVRPDHIDRKVWFVNAAVRDCFWEGVDME